jgi:hypothetical protein
MPPPTQEEEVEQGQGIRDYAAEFAEVNQRLDTLDILH